MSDIQKIGAEHSVDLDLLPEAPFILDVGARGYDFDYRLLELRPKARIIAIEPDPTEKLPADARISLLRAALTDAERSTVWLQPPGDGAYIATKGVPGYPTDAYGEVKDAGYGWARLDDKAVEVPNLTLPQLMAIYGNFFDLIKLDCEGSEFGLLEKWPGPIATQISVEFHDFANRQRWNDAYFEQLFAGPLKDYDRALFGLTPMGEGKHMGHWDTLLVKKA